MKHAIGILLFAVIFCLSGCTFPGNVGFESRNDRDVWVNQVDGFDRRVGAGIIGKKSPKYSYMGPMKFPKEVTIHWSYDWHKSDYTTKLSTEKIRLPYNDDRLIFVFTEDAQWEILVKKRK